MSPLSRNQKELAFDCCFGLPSAEQTGQAESLLAHNEQAAGMHARIQAALAPLESLHPEPCPEDLAERTMRRLRAIAPYATIECLKKLEGVTDRGNR